MVGDIIDFELGCPGQFPLNAKVPRQVIRIFEMVGLDLQEPQFARARIRIVQRSARKQGASCWCCRREDS